MVIALLSVYYFLLDFGSPYCKSLTRAASVDSEGLLVITCHFFISYFLTYIENKKNEYTLFCRFCFMLTRDPSQVENPLVFLSESLGWRSWPQDGRSTWSQDSLRVFFRFSLSFSGSRGGGGSTCAVLHFFLSIQFFRILRVDSLLFPYQKTHWRGLLPRSLPFGMNRVQISRDRRSTAIAKMGRNGPVGA